MPGVKALRKVQLGREGTAGTAVAATTLWRGEGVLADTRTIVWPAEDVGYLGGTDRTRTDALGGEITLTQSATFEQILHALEAGILTATPSQDGVGSGRIYAYPFPTTADATIKTYTIEGGDNIGAEEMEYAYCESFSLSGVAGAGMDLSAVFKGRQVAPTTFTGAIALPAVSDIITSKGKLFVDAIAGVIGTTLKSGTLLSFTLDVTTGLTPYTTMDGQTYFYGIKRGAMPEATLTLVFEHDAISVAQKAVWRAETAQLFRLQWEGPALTTPGTTYTYKTLRIDGAGKFESISGLEDTDGNNTVTAVIKFRQNTTAAKFCEITVVNDLTAVP